MKNILTLAAVLLSVSLPARAHFELDSLTSVIDLGPVAIAEARRSLLADIEDWKDDRRSNQPRRIMACIFGNPPAFHAPSAPLDLPVSELAQKVPFTDSERKVFASLLGRETDGLTDRLRLAIDLQSFLIKVSSRLYDQSIGEHMKSYQDHCGALTLGAERDTRLIRAAYQVLGLYNLLERELQD